MTVAGSLQIVADGVDLSGEYTSCEVERALDSFAHRFRFDVPGDLGLLYLTTGMQVTINRGAELLVSGVINRVTHRFAARELMTSIEGRSITADLVDCSATHRTGKGTWSNCSARAIIADLCEPFGILVDTSADKDTITAATKTTYPRFNIEPGETVFGAIDRVCKGRGLLPITRPDGALLLVRKIKGLDIDTFSAKVFQKLGLAVPVRRIGRNRVISHERSFDESERHSVYSTSVVTYGPQDASYSANVNDGAIKRFRPLVLVPDIPLSPEATKVWLQWQTNVRYGRSQRYRFSVSGTGFNDTESFVPGREYLLPDLFDSATDQTGVYSTGTQTLPTMLLERASVRVSSTEAVCDLEFVDPLAFSLEEDASVNISGLTKSKKKPKLIKHRAKNVRLTK